MNNAVDQCMMMFNLIYLGKTPDDSNLYLPILEYLYLFLKEANIFIIKTADNPYGQTLSKVNEMLPFLPFPEGICWD